MYYFGKHTVTIKEGWNEKFRKHIEADLKKDYAYEKQYDTL